MEDTRRSLDARERMFRHRHTNQLGADRAL